MEIKNIDKISQITQTPEKSQVAKPVKQEKTVNPFDSSDKGVNSKGNIGVEQAFQGDKLTPIEGQMKAKAALLNYFKNEFMKSDEFKKAFGNKTWDDVGDQVHAFLTMDRDKGAEKDIYQGKAYAYNAQIYGMHAEIAIDKKTGAVKKAYVEID